ncbi:hypothetical protein C1X27_08970 [Pseudomonas sp. MPR-AND1B]|nr:hypothetical protein C1X27_08970 [Pseudomonas sp. MPR-AND1B]POH43001.1 hypothetical protein C2U56_03210 [Pseudomonas fluorescens]RZI28341.1 hypothetical protein EUX58_02590 [Pseudomonas sp. 770NI]
MCWKWFRLNRAKTKCGSWLACDADTSVVQLNRGDAIAGKPAPTLFGSLVLLTLYYFSTNARSIK